MPLRVDLAGIRAPRTAVILAAGVVCAARTLASFGSPVALHEDPGFPAAVEHLRAAAPALVVVWPPHAWALDALPPELRAADAVPARPAPGQRDDRIAVVGPAGFDPPPELARAPLEDRRRHGGVEVRVYGPRPERRR